MLVISKNVELQNVLFQARKQGKQVGLVPTMGLTTPRTWSVTPVR